MPSAICFNLDQSKMLSSGNGLNMVHFQKVPTSVVLPTMLTLTLANFLHIHGALYLRTQAVDNNIT